MRTQRATCIHDQVTPAEARIGSDQNRRAGAGDMRNRPVADFLFLEDDQRTAGPLTPVWAGEQHDCSGLAVAIEVYGSEIMGPGSRCLARL